MLSLAHLTGRAFCMNRQKQKDRKGSLSPTARQGQAASPFEALRA